MLFSFLQEGKRIDFTIDIESAVGLPKRFNVCFMSISFMYPCLFEFVYRAPLAFFEYFSSKE